MKARRVVPVQLAKTTVDPTNASANPVTLAMHTQSDVNALSSAKSTTTARKLPNVFKKTENRSVEMSAKAPAAVRTLNVKRRITPASVFAETAMTAIRKIAPTDANRSRVHVKRIRNARPTLTATD